MTSSSVTRLVSGLVAIAVAIGPGHALAQQRSAADIESARQLYNQGLELRDRGDLAGAVEKLKAAHALGYTPITGVELCKTHAALGQPVEAREACLSVGRIPVGAAETPRSRDARNDAVRIGEEQRAKIASLRLRLSGVPAGQQPSVSIDGIDVPSAALGEPRALNPGAHTITARSGNGPVARVSFELAAGEAKEILLPVEPGTEQAPPPVAHVGSPGAPAATGAPVAEPAPKKKSYALAITGLSIAGVGALVGTATGISAMNGKSELEDRCTNGVCGRDDHAALDSANRSANVSTAFFVIGGVGLVLGGIGLLVSSRSSSARASATPVVGLGGAGVHGTF